jgi:transcriptional regulator with XRE-family HTH domain
MGTNKAIHSMRRQNALGIAPPFEVEQGLKRVGANLRTARLRRNLSLEAVAAKIGTGVRAVRDAENGRPGTSAAVYAALLWAYDLLRPFTELADPGRDETGLALASQRKHAYPTKGLDNDF